MNLSNLSFPDPTQKFLPPQIELNEKNLEKNPSNIDRTLSSLIDPNFDDGSLLTDSCRYDPSHPKNFYFLFLSQASARAKRISKALDILQKNKKETLAQKLKIAASLENHHIIPKHDNGNNDPNNLVLLTFKDHLLAHYVRFLIFKKLGDFYAYSWMLKDTSKEVRAERAALGGSIGGPITQAKNKEQKLGRFSSELQSQYGKLGAEKNRQQKTGAFDPTHLKKANQVLAEKKATDPEFKAQIVANLEKGRKTQKENKINIGDPLAQRRKSLYFRGVELNGIRYMVHPDAPVYHGVFVKGVYYPVSPDAPKIMCETTFEYYLMYAESKPTKKKKKEM